MIYWPHNATAIQRARTSRLGVHSVVGTAGIPFMYQLDETVCSFCFPLFIGAWIVFLCFQGYNEQKEAFDRLWSELKSAYRTKPEFQVFFLSVFLFYCFIFFALVLCRFGNYFIFPLIACWVGEIFFGSSYSYNFFLAFGITAMLLNMAGYILGTLRLLPRTADWIFTQLDKKTLYTIIGNPGGKVGRGVARMVWYSASIGIGTFAYDSAVAVRENHFMHQDMKEYTSTGAAITPTKLEEFQLKRDRRIDACRIAPKLQHLSSDINKTVTSLIGKDGPR